VPPILELLASEVPTKLDPPKASDQTVWFRETPERDTGVSLASCGIASAECFEHLRQKFVVGSVGVINDLDRVIYDINAT